MNERLAQDRWCRDAGQALKQPFFSWGDKSSVPYCLVVVVAEWGNETQIWNTLSSSSSLVSSSITTSLVSSSITTASVNTQSKWHTSSDTNSLTRLGHLADVRKIRRSTVPTCRHSDWFLTGHRNRLLDQRYGFCEHLPQNALVAWHEQRCIQQTSVARVGQQPD